MVLVVAIAGQSGSGKTWVTKQVNARIRGCAVIQADAYYKGCEPHEAETYNFDVPEAMDLDRLANDIQELKRGNAIRRPTYDFQRHRRVRDPDKKEVTVEVAPSDVLLVEGLFVLHHEGIRRLCDVTAFIDARENVCLARRIKRDSTEERKRDMDDVLMRLDHVNEGIDRYIAPSKWHASHIACTSDRMLSMLVECMVARGAVDGTM